MAGLSRLIYSKVPKAQEEECSSPVLGPPATPQNEDNHVLLRRGEAGSNPGRADQFPPRSLLGDLPPLVKQGPQNLVLGRRALHNVVFPANAETETDEPLLTDRERAENRSRASSNSKMSDVEMEDEAGEGGRFQKLDEDGYTPREGTMEMTNLRRAESSEALNLTLHQCARDGDVHNMERLLKQLTGNIHKKINKADDEQLSPLHYAARCNHIEIVRMLVEKGADVNNRGEEDATPLHYAARYRRETKTSKRKNEDDNSIGGDLADGGDPVVLYLLSKGANINSEDKYGLTPLHFAAMRGNEVAATELLRCKGINIEAEDKQNMTALHQAAIHNNQEVAQMLIQAGANLRCKDEDYSTPLHHACSEGNVHIVNMLFQAGARLDGWVTISQMVTDTDVDGSTCLHLAVDSGHQQVTKICIEKGADVNAPRTHYMFPLHLAAVAGDLTIVKLLLERGARIDVLNDNMETPLHKAAAYNHVSVVEHLVGRGAKVNRKDKDNYTPILIAAVKGNADTIDILLRMGADITICDKNDKTVIYLAAEENKLQAMERLLEHKDAADLMCMSDRYDNEPLHVAATNGFLGILKCLLDKGADIDCKNEEEQTPLHLAAKHGRTNVVRELVRRDKLVCHDEDEDSNTALHLAALFGQKGVAQVLIEAGANVEARNCSLWTPLDCAAAKGWVKTAKILLDNDAPVDPVDKTKTTPLHLASTYGHVACVNLLLEWQANITQRDTDGNNCLDLAIDNNREDAAMAIVSSERWEAALRNETLDLVTGNRNTPMRKLIKKMPYVAEKVFHQCTTSNNKPQEHPKYTIVFNYEFLDDMYSSWREGTDTLSSAGSVYNEDDKLSDDAQPYSKDSGTLKKNHPLLIMVNTKREDLLAHPLVTTLLRHKWNSYGRYIYYLNLFIYTIFLTFLTGYIVSTTAPYSYPGNAPGIVNVTCEDVLPTVVQGTFARIGKYVIMGLAGWNLLRELFQVYQAKLNYLGFENLIEWITYVTAFLLVLDFNECQRITGFRWEWQWILGAVAIFLAWIDLVLFIRKFPRFGIYVVMFTDILKTFAQFFVVFLLFIVGFALAFNTLLRNQPPFRTPGVSLVKTAVMMIGEFEYDSIFNDPTQIVHYPEISYIIFAIFMVLMSIIIMNLLVGLAVDDIKAVQEQAILKRLAMQVELALDVEAIMPQFLRRKFVIRLEKVFPNLESRNIFRRMFGTATSSLSSTSIAAALNPELDDMEIVQENQEKMQNDIKSLSKRMATLYAQNTRLESMLSSLLQQQGIDWQEEDVDDSIID